MLVHYPGGGQVVMFVVDLVLVVLVLRLVLVMLHAGLQRVLHASPLVVLRLSHADRPLLELDAFEAAGAFRDLDGLVTVAVSLLLVLLPAVVDWLLLLAVGDEGGALLLLEGL